MVVADMPEETRLEVPPSVPWLQGFEWDAGPVEEAGEANTGFDRLGKECAKLDKQAKGLLA